MALGAAMNVCWLQHRQLGCVIYDQDPPNANWRARHLACAHYWFGRRDRRLRVGCYRRQAGKNDKRCTCGLQYVLASYRYRFKSVRFGLTTPPHVYDDPIDSCKCLPGHDHCECPQRWALR